MSKQFIIVAVADNGNVIIRRTSCESYEQAYKKATEFINEYHYSVENVIITESDSICQI